MMNTMSEMMLLIDKISTTLERSALWGAHKDAERLKQLLKELESEIHRPELQTQLDSDAMEHTREIQSGGTTHVSVVLQDSKLDISSRPKSCS